MEATLLASSPFVIYAYILPTSFLLDLNIPRTLIFNLSPIHYPYSFLIFVVNNLSKNSPSQLHFYFHSEHPVVLTLYFYIVIYLYSP